MGNQDILDGDTPVFAKILEIIAGERRPQVGDDTVRQTESVNYILEQLGCFLRYRHDERLVLNLLGEFVNGNVYIFDMSWLERPDHV